MQCGCYADASRGQLGQWNEQQLTDTAESFLAETDQHIEAEIAVSRSIEMLQPPQMGAVLLHVLQMTTFNISALGY